jgi:hypothetical protein
MGQSHLQEMEGSEGDSRSGADRVGEAGRAVAAGAALDGGAVPRGFANAQPSTFSSFEL